MVSMSLHDYLERVQNAYFGELGDVLANLLSFRDSHVMSSKLMLEKPERQVESHLYSPLDEVVAAHLRTVWAVGNGDRVEAWKSQTIVVSAVSKFLQESKEKNWMLPVMTITSVDLRLFALAADPVLSKSGLCKPGETLEKAAESLMACFRVCVSDTRSTEEVTKRWGLLHLVNQFLKIYFKINKLNLCKPMIRAIEALPFKDNFPLSQLITYKYYTGRKAMFDSDFKTGSDCFCLFGFGSNGSSVI
ncbi:UNVERIFIED_CONTAM: hypothetical protein GTU68_026228 [Idotea baltica]|nr:hypothetical protein [Idotea baltica]